MTVQRSADRVRSARRGRPSLAEEIAATLKEDVLSGTLSPGTRLGEMDVAARFGSSQATVREALAMLRQEGLLTSLPRRGTFVSDVSIDDARIVFQLRLRVEPLVMALAVANVADADLDDLDAIVRDMEEAAAAADLNEFVLHDARFHARLYDLSGSNVLRQLWSLVETTVRKFVAAVGGEYFPASELPAVAAMHEALLGHIRRRDTAAAVADLTAQLAELWNRIGDLKDDEKRGEPA